MKKIYLLVASCLASIAAIAVNPYLPLWEYIPDGEPYVFEDPDAPGQYRIYVYGSHDSLVTEYCGREQVVWSAPVDNPEEWRFDGVIFESKYDANGQPLNPGEIGDVLYAPDVALKIEPDGSKTYYLYPNNQHGGRNGQVAKSSRPDGPFEVCNWRADAPNQTEGPLAFDPAVFVDDDGCVYAYWGFGTSNGAELDPATMATVKPGTEIVNNLIPGYEQDQLYRFFEASSIRKIDDKYILIYSRWTAEGEFGLPGTNYTLAYAYSDAPLGPFTYGGTIIDGRGRSQQPDGSVVPTATPSGNTHGSIAKVGDQWYVFYHRQTGLNEFSRQAMVAPIEVSVEPGPGGKVTISEGEYTSEGFQINGMPLNGIYPAGIACYYTGPEPAIHAWPSFIYSGSYVAPTYYPGNPRSAASDVKLRSCPVVNNTNGSTLGYKYFNFDNVSDTKKLSIELMPKGIDGTITVIAGAPAEAKGGKVLGQIHVNKAMSKAPTTLSTDLSGLSQFRGKQPLFFLFSSPESGVSLCDIYNFAFE